VAAVRPLVVVGDALLDRDLDGRVERLSPEGPVPVVEDATQRIRPGGAALAAALAARDGRPVTLVCALADDLAGRELSAALTESGVTLVSLPLRGGTPEKVRIRSGGHTLVRLDRGSGRPAAFGDVPEAVLAAVEDAEAVLVADYGYGLTALPGLRRALERVAAGAPVIWDPHPKGSPPVPGTTLATPNRDEASRFAGGDVAGPDVVETRARTLAARWGVEAVCVTVGSRGAVLATPDGAALHVPAPAAHPGDPCGAGDCFSAAAAAALADGLDVAAAVRAAVAAASSFVAAGGAAGVDLGARPDSRDPRRGADEHAAQALIARLRARGGTVVATGGCFDLLHAGHVRVLEGARALGDLLVVCLNTDASVRRLKGPTRPLNALEDRAAVLLALTAVDAVVAFDEDTPEALLARLRPDVWVKGGDYDAATLPETPLIEALGGRTVILPSLPDRSTTRLIEEVRARGD
jgi:rfaE bifunctional protein nucleotidyltransferase chain/domain/rfaE bifunctional protein kinase chain/domain